MGEDRVRCYRVCDRRYPFLWATREQPPGRWHDSGEGPCHYLATTPKGAWAEAVRHSGITDEDDLEDLELALWEVRVIPPVDVPTLDEATMTGGEWSYAACRAEARRRRAAGSVGFVAPSAAVLSGRAEVYAVGTGGQYVTEHVPTGTIVLFGAPDDLVGIPSAEGHPDPTILDDVRSL
jgi:hypothetical protein